MTTRTSDQKLKEMIPTWERVYENRKSDSFQLMDDDKEGKKGKYMIATKDIKQYDVVLIDDLLTVIPSNKIHPSLLMTNGEDNNAELFQQAIRTQQEIRRRYGHIEKWSWPLEVERRYCRVGDLNDAAYLLESPNLKEIWKLEDSIRQACVGDDVMIDGLSSEAGKKMNGRVGKVVKIDDKDPNRLGVNIGIGTQQNDKNNDIMKSIKRCNLKSLGGIATTNCYIGKCCEGMEKHMGALSCRINHACREASNVSIASFSHKRKAFVVATRFITKGEEILFDYLGGGYDGDPNPRNELQRRYGFWCDCALCVSKQHR